MTSSKCLSKCLRQCSQPKCRHLVAQAKQCVVKHYLFTTFRFEGEASNPGPRCNRGLHGTQWQSKASNTSASIYENSQGSSNAQQGTQSNRGNCKCNGKRSNSNCVSNRQAKDLPTKPAFTLEVCNITHLLNNVELLKKRVFSAALLSEHSTTPNRFSQVRESLGRGYKSHLSQLDKEKSKNVGGTGCVLRSVTRHIVQPKSKLKAFAEIRDKGRAGLYAFEVCPNVHVYVYIVYGWTGADTSDEAAARTDDLLCLCHRDSLLQADGPKLFVGDFNGSIHTFPTFNSEIRNGQLHDIGAIASGFGDVDNDTTCKANSLAKATRRDYVVANKKAMDVIDTMVVDHDPCFSVHDVLKITFKAEAPRHSYEAVALPRSLLSRML